MNVVLAGEESAGMQLLRTLAGSNHRLVAVLAQPAVPGVAAVSVWKAARDMGFQTWPAEEVRRPDLAAKLRKERVDVLLNVHSLYVVDNQVLKAPIIGAFNLHPGPLPKYAGLNAVSWAIFGEERQHGVTVHRMEPGIDTGAIAYQTCFPIAAEETGLSLSLKCVREGLPLMQRLLDEATKGPENIPAIPQDLSKREYFGRTVPNDGWVDWNWSASKVVALGRACDYFPFKSPWGQPRTRASTQEIALLKVSLTGLPSDSAPGTVGSCSSSGCMVACRDEWVLVGKLHVEGKLVPAEEILKSGDRLTGR